MHSDRIGEMEQRNCSCTCARMRMRGADGSGLCVMLFGSGSDCRRHTRLTEQIDCS